MENAVRGCVAGLIATGPMTWTMRAGEQLVPPRQRHDLPPQQITEQILEEVEIKGQLNGDQRTAVATLAHYAFGAAAGGLLSLAASRVNAPRPLVGAAVGMGVWASSYMGWLPALGIRQHALDEPAGRNLQMIAAHLVWGMAAGALLDLVGVEHEQAPASRLGPT